MLVLLPPSEAKKSPLSGPPVDLSALSHPELTAPRQRVAEALMLTSAGPDAATALRVGPSLAAEVERNLQVWTLPTAPAAHVYSGVLYDAARASQWSGPVLNRATERVRIMSALWGALSPADAIPPYRLSMGSDLTSLGALASVWRQYLPAVMTPLTEDRLVVDCRSADYLAPFKPRGDLWFHVRVVKESGGKRTVVSHFAKHTRGLLAGLAATADATPTSGDELAHLATELIGSGTAIATVHAVELESTALTVVVR